MDVLRNLVNQDETARTALDVLTAAGGTVYVVGGAVRDAVLGGKPKDIDLMVHGLTGEAIEAALAPAGILNFTGKAFGVYRFRLKGQDVSQEVEIAMPRAEVSTGPAHTDFAVDANPLLTPEEDLQRRDFTGNAMAYNPLTNEVIDPYGGQEDLANGTLRLVNDNAFSDDPLRIVRALAAASRQGLDPDPKLIESMVDNAPKVRHLPGERIQMEMDKILGGQDPAKAIEIAFKAGLMDYVAPELADMRDFDQQNPHHDLTVDQHTLAVLRKMTALSNDPDLRLAALFHDSGKPDSFWLDPEAPEGGGGHFYKGQDAEGNEIGADHEEVGAELVEAFMRRLRYPNKRIERVKTLVANHMFPYFNTPKGARKFLKSMNGDADLAYDLLKLREADASGKSTGTMNDFDSTQLEKARRLLAEVLDKEEPMSVKDLDINGNDVMAMGYKGPEIGRVLNMLLEAVLDNPELNKKENLLALLHDSQPRSAGRKISTELVIQQPHWKWSYDGQDLNIWRVDSVHGRPHHIEVTGMEFYKLAQGRVYIDWGDGPELGSPHKDWIEILVWEDRGTESLQDAAVQEVEQFLMQTLRRTSDLVSFQSEGIDWMNLGRTPTEGEIQKHYFYDPDDDEPWEVIEPEFDDPEPKSVHNMTQDQFTRWELWEDADIDPNSPYGYSYTQGIED